MHARWCPCNCCHCDATGNKFLDHIRQVAVLAHVVRCFEDSDILHVDECVDPIRDLETIRTELILADLQTVEKRLMSVGKKTKSVAVQALMMIMMMMMGRGY